MKRKLNIVFFSICFLASLLAEAYCFQVLRGDLFSIVGIGFVVLITGYLLLDTIRSKMQRSVKDAKFYFDRMYREETEKWTGRYTEIANLQKATYTAAKKNTATISEQFDEALLRLDTIESNNAKEFLRINELQKKALEGQKNALNLEVNYNKENTKQLIHVLREEGNKTEQNELLLKILEALEKNNALLQEQMQQMKNMNYVHAAEPVEVKPGEVFQSDYFPSDEENLTEDFYEELETTDRIAAEEPEENQEENASETSWFLEEEAGSEAMKVFDTMEPELEAEPSIDNSQTITPIYDDPNKALSADEIAALFASFGQ